jgi:hypothetical protein
MALRNGTFGRVASRSWFDADAYDVGWFTDEMIPPSVATPPVTRSTRRWGVGSMRLIAGRKV